jgi:hypothetical protein
VLAFEHRVIEGRRALMAGDTAATARWLRLRVSRNTCGETGHGSARRRPKAFSRAGTSAALSADPCSRRRCQHARLGECRVLEWFWTIPSGALPGRCAPAPGWRLA